MRLLCTSDWQVGAGAKYGRAAYGPGSRLADQEQVLARIAELARKRDVDLIVHAGDVLHTRTPSVAEILVAKRALEQMPCPVLVVAGNHDRAGADRPATPEIFETDEIEVALRPGVVHYPEASIAALPWASPGTFIAKAGRDGDVNAEISAVLVDIAAELRAQCQPGLPAVLVLHWWVEGATTAHGVGEGVIHEPVLPWSPLEEQDWVLVVAGHVHLAQLLSRGDSSIPRGFYCGPPSVTDFGEAEVAHGVWIVDLADPWQPEFVALPDRDFLTMSADISEREGASLPWLWPDDLELMRDAVVRVRYRATAEQARRIDQAQVRANLEEMGAWRVFLEPDIVRESDRRRVDGVDEHLSPLAAVALWCTAQELDGEPARRLREYTAAKLELEAA